MKTVLAFAATLGLCLVLALPVSAGGNGVLTMTVTTKNAVTSFPNDPPLCNTPAGTVILTYNSVFHFTIHSDGTFSDTGTMAGDVVLVPSDASQPSFTGHFADWFNDHGVATFGPNGPINGTDTSNSTMSVHATGSDGSTLDAHSIFKGQFTIVGGNFIPVQILHSRATC
jgi:hypothetical protein